MGIPLAVGHGSRSRAGVGARETVCQRALVILALRLCFWPAWLLSRAGFQRGVRLEPNR
jgi:hypothetical protein